MSDLASDRRPLPLVLSLLTAVSLILGLAPHQPVFAAPRHGAGCTIQGTSGADRLVGTPQDDVICGEQGDDLVSGGGGDDTVVGGNGQDVLFGGPGADVLQGGNGKDLLIGGTGRDTVDGGNAKDECDGVSDGDVLSGCESAEPAGLSVEDGKPGAAADPTTARSASTGPRPRPPTRTPMASLTARSTSWPRRHHCPEDGPMAPEGWNADHSR
ncbi:hypothetical protein GMA12_07015 [Kocuria sediminis]|uniref:Calcium-binding protein n=1 Tax=Kocuria sediminis TaxID=1038857 RepID=A0A6N8GIH2_9MICC|nr:calcium-binding protein [Kocuria sediminis]MUN62891.1 hypothetical protein [Kocuria sediminis]